MNEQSRGPATIWKYQIVGSELVPAVNHSEIPNSFLTGEE